MSTHLRPVNDDGTIHEIQTLPEQPISPVPTEALGTFEGQDITFSRCKITGANDIEVDEVFHIDNYVRLLVEGRVVRVDHVVDERSGKMKRIQTIKVIDAFTLPDDETPGRGEVAR